MDKQQIKELLLKNHQDFIAFFDKIDSDTFEKKVDGKWSPGQNLKHIYESVKPLAALKTAPKFFIKTSYGKAKKGSRSFDDTFLFYQSFLNNGGKASGKYSTDDPVSFSEKEELIKKLLYKVHVLIDAIDKFNEKDLDELQLPHPLMGKLTMREMFYFTTYHVTHHLDIVNKHYKL